MPNPAINQLIAAGASPKRARAFTEMVANKAQPMSMPEVATPQIMGAGVPEIQSLGAPKVAGAQPMSGLKPKGPGEWYSDDYAAASQSWASGKGLPGYQPPEFGTPEFTQYYEYTKGPGAYSKFENNLLAQYAPTFNKAQKSTNIFDKSVVGAIKKGLSLTEISELIAGGTLVTPLTIEQQNAAATKLFNEYSDATAKGAEFLGKSDPNYRYKLPDPKFKYGATTNFKTGTVDVLNNFWANGKYKAYEQQLISSKKYTPAQITQALSKAKTQLATAVTKSGVTPFKDEQARRDALKKGK